MAMHANHTSTTPTQTMMKQPLLVLLLYSFLLSLSTTTTNTQAFLTQVQRSSSFASYAKPRVPSKVQREEDDITSHDDRCEDTGDDYDTAMEIVSPDDLPNMTYDETPPNTEQEWRRGDVDGCDDPMDAPWRVEGERIIYEAADSIQAKIQDITWGMAMCTITVGDTSQIQKPMNEYLKERKQRDDANPYMREQREAEISADCVDMEGVQVLAGTIIEALQAAEENDDNNAAFDVLSRHDIIVTSPGVSNVLETQKQFNAFKGFDVIVQTVDPFGSNRVLEGTLVERNALDLIIAQKGRKVTIPLNFVDYVELPKAKREKGDNML